MNKDIEALLKIIDIVGDFKFSTDKFPYTIVSAKPITFIYKNHPDDYEIKLYRRDDEPGVSFYESLSAAFASYGARDAAKLFLLIEADEKDKITDKHIPIMVKLVKHADAFCKENEWTIDGPWVSGRGSIKPFWCIYHKNLEEMKVLSLSAAFKRVGLLEESKIIKKYVEGS